MDNRRVKPKNSIWRVFVFGLLKSLIAIGILVGVGAISYNVSFYFLSKSIKKGTEIGASDIEELKQKAKVDEVAKNLIFVHDDDNKIVHLALEIFNKKTNNLDYITIPVKTDFQIDRDTYQRLSTINQEIPQVVRICNLRQYFDKDQDAYGYAQILLQNLLGIEVSYYTVIDRETFMSHYAEKPVTISFKKKGESEDGSSSTKNVKQKMSIVTFSEGYRNQLTDLDGDEEKIADYISAQYERVLSNLSSGQMVGGYVDGYKKINLDYVHFWGIPGSYSGNSFVLAKGPAKQFIASVIENEAYTAAQDLDAVQKTPTTTKSVTEEDGNKKVISSKGKDILILNGSKINGLAAKTQTRLEDEGFTVKKVDDYKDEVLTKTRIIVSKEGQGEDLAEYFSEPKIVVGDVKKGYDIEIILGTTDANQ